MAERSGWKNKFSPDFGRRPKTKEMEGSAVFSGLRLREAIGFSGPFGIVSADPEKPGR
jgi:hypothetical protein